MNVHIYLCPHFTQNSVVNVNWHIDKKKEEEENEIARKLKKSFSGVGGLMQ